MIGDENLQNSQDYSEGQKKAAFRVLVELCSLFEQYRDDIRIIGGWVPELLFPNQGHVGSVDVDVLINHLALQDEGYQTMKRILLKNGYAEHPIKYFSFIKRFVIEGISYAVDVDILSGIYGGTKAQRRSQHIQGLKALKATGGNFAFKFEPIRVKIEASRPDGALDVAYVSVVSTVPYLVMKTAALGRGKAKDAYDIYFLIKHYHGGIEQLANDFMGYSDMPIIQTMKDKLSEKFASEKHVGPVDVSRFLALVDEQEIEMVCRDAFEQVQALLSSI